MTETALIDDTKPKRKRKVNYINNQKFLEELIAHRANLAKARAEGKQDPILPDYIGKCFLQIAEKYSRKPQFGLYPFREEMVYDALENCILYWESFDPEKGKNPFAYFTQVTHYAFLRRIEKEKYQLYVKFKSLENFMLENVNSGDINDGTLNDSAFNINTDYMNTFVQEFEDRMASKKAAKKLSKKSGELDIE
ncbi:sigma factor for late transcription [Sinorhizobium phage phiM7]|uniref:RNA polymerase sigma-like factor n=2 Tax=Emdodecavirus TaxID=1980937 RepID=S5M6K2_9CAUD|nr:late sigma transcription factor [Sinorhizobium phage phiM12]YP_009601160.1 late sigma transcription factor [Sinorhizobium phage phiM7]AGR47681.1 sigma factor for late transcription [Sinorhizobium phage phiM12]AKF12583.1 sigma factor for late transcription [Sinorhizobium phage phiM7]AKF12943.1 sigma factor for late transcription [Sinorhizobium phage phiM19]